MPAYLPYRKVIVVKNKTKFIAICLAVVSVLALAWHISQPNEYEYHEYTAYESETPPSDASPTATPAATPAVQTAPPRVLIEGEDFILWDFSTATTPGVAPYFRPSIYREAEHAAQNTSIVTMGNEAHSQNSTAYIGAHALRWAVEFPFDSSSGLGLASGSIPQNEHGLNPTSIGMWVRLCGVTFTNTWNTTGIHRMFVGVSTTPTATDDSWRGFTPTTSSETGWNNTQPPRITHEDWFWLEFPLNPNRWLTAAQTAETAEPAFTQTQPLYFPNMNAAQSNAAGSFFGFRHLAGAPFASGAIYVSGLTFFYNYDGEQPIFEFSGPAVQTSIPAIDIQHAPVFVTEIPSAPITIDITPCTHAIDWERSNVTVNGVPIALDGSYSIDIYLHDLEDAHDHVIEVEIWNVAGFRTAVYQIGFRIDTDPVMASDALRNELLNRVAFAENRLRNATPVSATISAGRHSQQDMDAFALEIFLAKHIAESQFIQFEHFVIPALENINNAISTFMSQIIEPDVPAGALGTTATRYGQREEASNPTWHYIAQGEDILQRDTLRGAWLTTAWNIDFPSTTARGTTPIHVDRQRAELRASFEALYATGINAVIFQVSPHGCVFFRSEMAPWSFFLTGEIGFMGELVDSQGRPWDPLEYAIQLAREFNMEFHAWFNPYRVGSTATTIPLYGGNVRDVMTTPEAIQRWPRNPWFLFGDEVRAADSVYYVNPGLPEVRNWVVERILEVVLNYDIDVLHFDDYFYWAGTDTFDTFLERNTLEHNTFTNQVFPNTREGYNDWRRENTSLMVQDVSDAIRTYAPWVRFGISPAGVFSRGDGRTGAYGEAVGAPGTGIGSTAGGYFNYQNSFADTRMWVIRNTIDYITPQLYWCVNNSVSPFGAIADWWARLIRDYGPGGQHVDSSPWGHTYTQLFAGLAPYRVDRDDWGNYRPATQFEGMRNYIRLENYSLGHPYISGSMMFTTRDIIGDGIAASTMYNMRNQTDMAGSGMWRYTALVPPARGLGAVAPRNPVNVARDGNDITWTDGELSNLELIRTRYFVIYGANEYPVDISHPGNILAVVQAGDTPGESYGLTVRNAPAYIVVTASNRLHYQSIPGFEPVEGMSSIGRITANGTQLGGTLVNLTGPTVNFTGLVTGHEIRGIYATLTIGGQVIDVSDRLMRRGSDTSRTQVPISLTYTFEPQHFGVPITLAISTTFGATSVQFILEEPAPPIISAPANTARIYTPGFQLPFLLTAEVEANQAVEWAVTGVLPRGVSYIPRGRFYLDFFGVPTQIGEFQIIITATNQFGAADSRVFTMVVEPPRPPVFTTAANLPNGALEMAYNFVIETETDYAITWTAYQRGLPPGLTFVNGAIRGTPTEADTFSFEVRIENPHGGYTTREFTLTIDPEPTLQPETRMNVLFDFENISTVPFVRTNWVVGGNETSTTQLAQGPGFGVYAGEAALHWHITEVGTMGPSLSAHTQTRVPQQGGQNPTGMGFWIKFDNMSNTNGAGMFWHDMPLRVGLLNGTRYTFWAPTIDRSPAMANQWQWVEICFINDTARIPAGNAVVDFDPSQPLFIPGQGTNNAHSFIFFRQLTAANADLNIYIDNITFLFDGITGEQANFAHQPPTIDYIFEEIDGEAGISIRVRDLSAGLNRHRLQVLVDGTNIIRPADNAIWASPQHMTANIFVPKADLPGGEILTIQVVAWNNGGRVNTTAIEVDMRSAAVASVTILPNTAEVRQVATRQFEYSVETINAAPEDITWSVSGHVGVSIDENGLLTVGRNVPVGTTLTVAATSVFDAAVYDTAQVTVAEMYNLVTNTHYIAWGFGNATTPGNAPYFRQSITGAGNATAGVGIVSAAQNDNFHQQNLASLFGNRIYQWDVSFPHDGSSGIGNAQGRIPQNSDGRNPTTIGVWIKLDGVYLTDLVRMTLGVSTAQHATQMTFRGFTPTLGSSGIVGTPGNGDPGLLTPQDGWVFVEFPLYTGLWLNNTQGSSRGVPFSPTQELWFPSGTSTGNNIVGSFLSMRHLNEGASGTGSIYIGGIVFFYNYDNTGRPVWDNWGSVLFPATD